VSASPNNSMSGLSAQVTLPSAAGRAAETFSLQSSVRTAVLRYGCFYRFLRTN
jgi:hypothetical protein